MLVADRHQKITELVNERKSIRVTELSRFFSVTEETIRRDLEKLEKEGKLARSHGGAVSLRDKEDSSEVPFSEREITNVKEKKEIAAEAVKLVGEGDKIILDASSTAWYMARALPDMPVTVVTNSLKAAMELSSKKQVTVISTGGTLVQKSLAFVGPLAESSLDDYHVNKAFISCKGIHAERGISESDEQHARVKKKMMESADTVYIMVDHSKFGVQAFARLGGLDMVDHIITDSKVDGKIAGELAENELNLIKVGV